MINTPVHQDGYRLPEIETSGPVEDVRNGHRAALELMNPVGRCLWCGHHLFKGDRHGGGAARYTRDCDRCAWCDTWQWRGGRPKDGAQHLQGDLFAAPPAPPRYLDRPARVNVVSDGTYYMDGGQFYGSVPRQIWERWRKPNRRHQVIVPMNGALVSVGGVQLLVDPGMGMANRDAALQLYGHKTSKLARSLRDLDVTPRKVDVVAVTHAHYSHAGGLAGWNTRQGEYWPTFKRSRALIQRRAWEEMISGPGSWQNGPADHSWARALQEKNLALVDGPAEAAPGVWMLPDGAHCPGHQVIVVNAGTKAVIPGDLAPTPEHVLYGVVANGLMDQDGRRVLELRRRLLEWALGEWLWIFPHALGDVAGYFERRRGRLVFLPVINISSQERSNPIDWRRVQ